MQLQGSVNINAPRNRVWVFITDPDAVARCAPGVESMEVIEPNRRFKVVASIGFGTVKVKFNTEVELADLVAPERGRIKAKGTGQGNTVSVAADFTLADAANRTTDLAWTANVSIAGSIAGVAMRLMGSVTETLSGKFFECMKGQVEVAEGIVEEPVVKPSLWHRLMAAIRAFVDTLLGRKP